MKQIGIVDWFGINKKKNSKDKYGFITTFNGGSIFVHELSLTCEALDEDDVVCFELSNGKNGKGPKANKVVKLTTENIILFQNILTELEDEELFETIEMLSDKIDIDSISLLPEQVLDRMIKAKNGRRLLEPELLLDYFIQEFKRTHSIEALDDFVMVLNEMRYAIGTGERYWSKIEMFHFTQIPDFSYQILPYWLQKKYLAIYAAKDLHTLSPNSILNLYNLFGFTPDPFAGFMPTKKFISLVETHRKNERLLKLNEHAYITPVRTNREKIEILISHLSEDDLLKQTALLSHIAKLVAEDPEAAYALPEYLLKEPAFFEHIPPIEQTKLIWDSTKSEEISQFVGLLKDEGTVLLFYKMTFERDYKQVILNALLKHHANKLVWAVGHLFQCTHFQGQERDIKFRAFHDNLAGYLVELIDADNQEYINLSNRLFPNCAMGRVRYCEARVWGSKVGEAYCPRYKKGCSCQGGFGARIANRNQISGAKMEPNQNLSWEDWSLLEFFHALRVTPSYPGDGLHNPKEYVNRMGGWMNRIIELKERLKCSHCQTPFKSNINYAKRLAVYNQTIFHCVHMFETTSHDRETYISHCWSCKEIIDSRDGYQRLEDYYLCVECGSGHAKSKTHTQGDICPKCGERHMKKSEHHRRGYKCRNCTHKIIVPQDDQLTGRPERIAARKKEIYQTYGLYS
ncbi:MULTISPECIES: cold shock domain-containing protein [Bacillus cereus group]|uniref:cold shock domain-containing protein n=1 Tax=Bacillus cereus group TaxID=86661 RepID=UPI0024BC5A77|nr:MULTISPECIES: cold shock domain-containing protein [Bacillus cereus group]MED3396738.1 cold shock domain-containing protein [Bacillus wiedmannii]